MPLASMHLSLIKTIIFSLETLYKNTIECTSETKRHDLDMRSPESRNLSVWPHIVKYLCGTSPAGFLCKNKKILAIVFNLAKVEGFVT